MSELKPTDKGYIEAVCKKQYEDEGRSIHTSYNTIPAMETGYTLALEHNNVPELIEAAKAVLKDVEDRLQSLGVDGIEDSLFSESLLKLQAEVTKAEQNKLNK